MDRHSSDGRQSDGQTAPLRRQRQAETVAAGEFAPLEQAARRLIDERIDEIAAAESDDLAWAKPYVDEARAAVARGEFVSLEEHKAHNTALPASLKT